MGGAGLDPLACTVDLVLVATLEEPVTNVVTVEGECIEDMVAGAVAVGVLHVDLRADGREEHVGTLLDALQDEDAGLAGREFAFLTLSSLNEAGHRVGVELSIAGLSSTRCAVSGRGLRSESAGDEGHQDECQECQA